VGKMVPAFYDLLEHVKDVLLREFAMINPFLAILYI
jgi:hypothetical protein